MDEFQKHMLGPSKPRYEGMTLPCDNMLVCTLYGLMFLLSSLLQGASPNRMCLCTDSSMSNTALLCPASLSQDAWSRSDALLRGLGCLGIDGAGARRFMREVQCCDVERFADERFEV